MKLAPMIPYYGSKHRLAKSYPEPRHGVIVEPFAGGAGYALRYSERKVVLVERDARTAAVWRFLISATSDDILGLPLLEPEQAIADLNLSAGAAALVGWWCNPGSGSGPGTKLYAWARSFWPDIPPKFWGAKCRARIAKQVAAINHWEIIEANYSDAPDIDATWYVDPPYQDMGKCYKHGSDDIDFPALGQWCKSRKGQTIVCENEGADWLPFRYHGTQHGAAAEDGSRKRSVEVIWTNDPPEQVAMFGQEWFGAVAGDGCGT